VNPADPDVINFILERVEIDDETSCWVWQRSTSRGYGKLNKGGVMWYAHRFSYHHLVAHLPKSAVVHHTCARRDCVNPDHLQVVTPGENTAEMRERNAYNEEINVLRDTCYELRRERDELREQVEVAKYVAEFFISGTMNLAAMLDGICFALDVGPRFDHPLHSDNHEIFELDPEETLAWWYCMADWKPMIFSIDDIDGRNYE